MTPSASKSKRFFTDFAREAALAARLAKHAEPDDFGIPRAFVVRTGPRSYAWEIRRFGGVVVQRGGESFDSMPAAKEAGEEALAALCATPGFPTFKRQNVS